MTNDLTDLRIAALEHSRALFAMHAGQRMQLVNFFIVAAAFLTGAFVNALAPDSAPQNYVAAAISSVGVVVSVLFLFLEQRTKKLVKIGEGALKSLERGLADELKLDELRLCERAECESGVTYGFALWYFYRVVAAAFALGTLWALAHSPLQFDL